MEVAASTASLMNAIKNCVAEFTKIHMQHIKFQQTLHLMEVKHNYKMSELKMRKELYSNNSNSDLDSAGKPEQLIEWETEGAFEYMKFLKNKK